MPTLTGNWAPSASRNQRMRLRLVYTVTTTATQATVSADLYVDAGYSLSDRNNSLAWSGAFGSGSSSQSITPSTNGSQKLRSFSRTVNLSAAQQSLPFSASLSGVEYVGATASVSGSLVVPAQQATKPPATPASTRALRRSDTQHEIGWASVSGATSYRVLRRDLQQPNWETIARPSGSASAIIDRGTVSDRRYRWAVRAVNSMGESESALTRFLRTTPAAAADVRIVNRTASGIEVAWIVHASYSDNQAVQAQSRTPGGSWSAWGHILGLDGLGSAVTSALVPDAQLTAGREYRFRVRTDVTSETDAELMSWSAASPVVVPLAPPSAPLLLAPTGTQVAGEPLNFSWRHRPVDGSVQSSAQWELRGVGDASTVRTTSGDSAAETLTAGEYEWRARTKGLHADWGSWSAWQRFTVAERPTASLVTPSGSTWQASRLPVEVVASDSSGARILSVTIELSGDSGVIERHTLTGSRESGEVWRHTLATSLDNNTNYTVSASVTSGVGLSSTPATQSFSVAFAPPPKPSLTVGWNSERASASLAILNPEPGAWDAAVGTWGDQAGTWENLGTDGPAAVANRVERSHDGGETWQEVAADLPLGAGWIDWSLPLGGDVLYRAVALTADGAEAASDPVSVDARSGLVVLTASNGNDWLALEYNLSLPAEHGREVVTPTYLGDALPTAHYGLPASESVTVEATQIRDMDEPPLPRLAGWLDGNLWYRDPEGRAWWATLSGSLSISQSHTRSRQVGFTATRIQQPEGVEWPRS